MKKIAAVTFHRAQNFGSALQTYALKECVLNLAHEAGQEAEYAVIDRTSESQKELYRHYKKVRGLNDIIKNMVIFFYSKAIRSREEKFAAFLDHHIALTTQPDADYYISGSDQIWNVRAKDFFDLYYLDFVQSGKKLSYAASFGPLAIDWERYDKEKYAALLSQYSALSVREQGSGNNVKLLTGKDCDVHVDPTLLLKKEQWQSVQSDANYKDGKYILLYCLEPSKRQLGMAKAISKQLDLPIVVLRYNNKNDMFNSFVKRYDAGPTDFLSYIDHAALVLTSSFHGTAFSLIYHKPFYVFDGMKDNRIADILTKTDMTARSIESEDELEKVNLDAPDAEAIEQKLDKQRARSFSYLKGALDLE